jgi:glycosyltransferase involved in cell wall biosynthesis
MVIKSTHTHFLQMERAMDIALITEGTYPYHEGGVSTWCDQLVRGLAPHRFSLHTITATGLEPVIWKLPENVTGIWPVALWGPAPRPSRGLAKSEVLRSTFEQLITSIVQDGGENAFEEALRQLYELSRETPLAGALRSQHSVQFLLEAMRVSAVSDRVEEITSAPPSLADAITALDLIEHQLRPLFSPAPRADLCHASANGLAVLTAMTARWAHGTPLVMSEHGVYLRERYLAYAPTVYRHPARTMMLNFFKRLIRVGYQAADVIAPCCEYNRRWEVINGALPERIRPVYNGVDSNSFPMAETDPDVPTLIWVGRIDPLKDVETLLRAFALIRAEVPGVLLRIFGGTPKGNEAYHARCQRLLEELGLGGAATFEGRIAPASDAYQAGHVVLLTSISEGFPYTLIEAMASGRPTVSTDVGGVREAGGDVGVTVPPRNAAAIADACILLLADAERRKALGVAARERILAFFTVEQSMEQFASIYSSVTALPIRYQAVGNDGDRSIGARSETPPVKKALPALGRARRFRLQPVEAQ